MNSNRDVDEFCEECSYSLDLHDGEDSCDYAKHKADVINSFFAWVPR